MKWKKHEIILIRVTHETNYEYATMNPRYSHSYFMSTAFLLIISELQCARISLCTNYFLPLFLSFLTKCFIWFIWFTSTNLFASSPDEDTWFAFNECQRCRNLCHSFARSRNVKWPRTWLACLHSGSRLNDVGNEWDQSIHRAVCRFPEKENEGNDETVKR